MLSKIKNKMGEIKMNKLEVEKLGFLASYNVPFGEREFSPAIRKTETGYSIRILKDKNILNEWRYFETDEEGVIIESPHGYGKHYNKKVQILNIKEKCDEYKNKRINHRN